MIAVTIRKLVVPAMVMIAIAGCAGSGNSANDAVSSAKAYVRTIGPDAAQVQTYEIKVGLDILHNDPTGLAQDAQAAHDTFVNAKTDIIAAGNNVSDNDRLGSAELQMDDAINELKNGMGAMVAFAENPNAGTLGSANSKFGQGITDWDQAATVLWTMAGQASEIPTLAGSTQASTKTNAPTKSGPSASSPSNPPVSQTAINTAQQALSLLSCGGATTPLGVAFALGNSQMVTANHLTAACTGPGPDISSTPINVTANDMTHDLALLSPGGSQSLPLESAAPFAGEHIALLAGSPGSTPIAYMGQIIATNQPVSLSAATSNASGESLPDAIEVDTGKNVWGGATGGPAIDAAGNVVGVIVGEGSGVAWLTPVSDVKALLASAHPPPPPPSNLPPTFTPALWSNDANFTCTEGALAVTQSTITGEDVFYCASTDNISHVLCWESGVSATSGGQNLGYDVKPGPQPMCPGAQPLR